MAERLRMPLLSVMSVCLLLLLGSCRAVVEDIKPSQLAAKLDGAEDALVLFIKPDCSFSKAFTPVYERLSAHHSSEPLKMIRVDCTVEKDIARKYISGVPTIKYFPKHFRADLADNFAGVEFSDSRTEDKIDKWLNDVRRQPSTQLMSVSHLEASSLPRFSEKSPLRCRCEL
eukprot:GILJ01001307.1.p1 GENE.GILJ01001307.1~~GILJ01001307.1.p1  ORF type:complete len:181 (+),score=21.33 GILJ01001307.1:29-544(+)